MTKSDQLNELGAALAKAQGEMSGAIKDSQNPFFKSNYADLFSVWDAIRGPLTKNGLSVLQTTDQIDGGIVIETTLLHSSGQWVQSSLMMPLAKHDAQTIGGAITYGRRYGLSAITGIAQMDDDGETAMGRPIPDQKPQQVNTVTRVSSPVRVKA